MKVNPRTALLQALLEGEGYGRELLQRLERRMGKPVLSAGSIYPTLRDLERDGLVVSREGESTPERGGRPRIYYELTGEGLRKAREEWEAGKGLFSVEPPIEALS